MKFVLEIELGNEEMQTPEHVRWALQMVAGKRDTLAGLNEFTNDDSGTVWDVNGNTVGKWEVQS